LESLLVFLPADGALFLERVLDVVVKVALLAEGQMLATHDHDVFLLVHTHNAEHLLRNACLLPVHSGLHGLLF
jgi:hypothetical protein